MYDIYDVIVEFQAAQTNHALPQRHLQEMRSTTIYIPTSLRVMTDIFGWLELISSLQRNVVLLNGLLSPVAHHFKPVEPPNTPERFVKWTTLRMRKLCTSAISCK